MTPAIATRRSAGGNATLVVESDTEPAIPQSEELVGQHYRVPGYYDVGREKIREYARAAQNDLIAHRDEEHSAALGYPMLVAPVTFTAILSARVQHWIFEDFLTRYDMSQVLLTEQRMAVYKPVLAGDRLVCDVYLESFREGHGQDALVFRNEITDVQGAEVQTTWTTMVARTGGAIDEHLSEFVRNVMPIGG